SIARASGIFFEQPTSARRGGSEDDNVIGGLKQFFGYTPEAETSSLNKTSHPGTEPTTGFYDDVDTALEEATDTVDGLWQQFKKGLFSLMGSFSVGDDGDDGQVAPTKATVPPTPAQQATKPIANETSAVTEPAPAAAVASSTTTKATVEIIASTTAATKTATEATSAEATTTRVTASTVETTTTSPPATSTGAP
ncbi:hypothetical protein KR074_009938, partial [Drosophila pseudoananassae]